MSNCPKIREISTKLKVYLRRIFDGEQIWVQLVKVQNKGKLIFPAPYDSLFWGLKAAHSFSYESTALAVLNIYIIPIKIYLWMPNLVNRGEATAFDCMNNGNVRVYRIRYTAWYTRGPGIGFG